MTTQLHVESAIERSLGNKHEIRFWLATEVNGRKVESRGSVITIEQPTVQDARQQAHRMASYAQMRIDGNEMDAREANAALASIIAEIPALDAEWDKLTKSFE